METLFQVLLILLSIHALAKFLFFFVVPYPTRRRALDKSYAGRTSATKVADTVSVLLCVVLVALLLAVGFDSAAGFPVGLWVGATLVQVFFHRFSTPVEPEHAPEAPLSPIKMLSYAVQERPGRALREILVLAALFLLAAALLISDLVK